MASQDENKSKTSLNSHDNDILKRIFNPSLPYDDKGDDEIEQAPEEGAGLEYFDLPVKHGLNSDALRDSCLASELSVSPPSAL